MSFVIALDGPSGTGKSTVSRLLATRLGARYLDTGAMYRAATLAVLRAGVPLGDAASIARAVAEARVDVGTDPQHAATTLDGRPVEAEIRSAPVTAAVSAVSAVADVRARLLAQQRAIIEAALDAGTGIVVEGRDIGSTVWPAARPKVFLTASPQARARRRAAELRGGSGDPDVATVAAELDRRDRADSSRAASPLAQAADSVELDTTELGVAEVVEHLVALAAGVGSVRADV